MLTSCLVLCLLAIGCSNGQNWFRLPGSAVQISAKSEGLYIRSVHNEVFSFNWAANKWVKIKGGNFKALGATPDGYIWTTITDQKARRLDAATNRWEYPGNSKQIPKVRMINAISKDHAIAADVNNAIWYFHDGQWVKQGDNVGVCAAMGNDGDRWAINDQGRIFRLESGGWIEKSTPYTPNQTPKKYQIDVQNADRVIVTNGQLAYVRRDDQTWAAIDGFAKAVSINHTHIFRVSNEMSTANYPNAMYYASFFSESPQSHTNAES